MLANHLDKINIDANGSQVLIINRIILIQNWMAYSKFIQAEKIKINYKKYFVPYKKSSILMIIFPIQYKHPFPSISNQMHLQNQFRNTKSQSSYYMAKQSPFSLYYREIIDNCEEQSRTIANQPDISEVINKNNISKSIFQDEKSSKSIKKESKIKVFGLSDKKKSKENIINEFSESIDTNPKLQLIVQQNQQNLLQSDRLAFKQKQEILDKTQKIENEQLNFSQLHKLLDLSSQIVLEINEHLKQNMQHQVQNQIGSQESLKLAIMPSEKIVSLQKSKYEQKQLQKQDIQQNQTESHQAKTDSCLMNLKKPDKSHQVDEKINFKITDELSEKVQYQISEVKRLNEQDLTQKKNSNKSILQSQTYQKNNKVIQIHQQKPPPKHKFFIPFTNQITQSKTFNHNVRVFQSGKYCKGEKTSRELNEITEFELSQKQQTNKSKSQVPLMSSEKQKKSMNLANFFNQYGTYSLQIQNLINRCEKVSKLKQKDKELKKQINQLDKQTYRSANIDAGQYYFPHEYTQEYKSKQDHPHLYYTNQLQPKHFRQSFQGTRQKNEKSYDDETFIDRCHSEGGIKYQLNHNVANMQKIIKRFKQISKNIYSEKGTSDIILIQSKHRKQAQQQTIDKDHNQIDSQHQNFRSQYFGKSSQKIKNQSNMTQTMPIMKSQKPRYSQNFQDSVEEINAYEVPNTSKKENGQFYRMKMTNKDTARTQKKCGNNTSLNNQLLSGQSLVKYQCMCQHQLLLKQINKLNKKIQQIQQNKQTDIKLVRSLEPFDKKSSLKKSMKKSVQRQQEHYSQEQDTVNVSIPQQQNKRIQDFKNEFQNKIYNKYVQTKQQKQTKRKQHSQRKKLLSNMYKKKEINFPIFFNFPSRKDCLSELVQIGQYMFRLLYKFVINHQNLKIQQLTDKCSFKVKKYLDCIHYFTNNQLNYHLVYYFKGKIYFGEWQNEPGGGNGYKSGVGYYYHPNRYVYEGQFALNYKHGYGIAYYYNGQFYEGHWNKGKKQGKGVLINCMGDVYKGYFKLGRKNGKGEEQLNNGDRYKGQFRNGKIDGIGLYYWADGSRYRGQFKDGKLEGNGIWRSKENDYYEGQFKNNKKYGEGVYKWNNGVVLEGYFKEEQKNVRSNLKISEKMDRAKRKSLQYKQRGDYGRKKLYEQYLNGQK